MHRLCTNTHMHRLCVCMCVFVHRLCMCTDAQACQRASKRGEYFMDRKWTESQQQFYFDCQASHGPRAFLKQTNTPPPPPIPIMSFMYILKLSVTVNKERRHFRHSTATAVVHKACCTLLLAGCQAIVLVILHNGLSLIWSDAEIRPVIRLWFSYSLGSELEN